MVNTRIYVVTHAEQPRLIEAGSAAQAIRHCVRASYSAKAATPKDIAALMHAGHAVEHASPDVPARKIERTERTEHAEQPNA